MIPGSPCISAAPVALHMEPSPTCLQLQPGWVLFCTCCLQFWDLELEPCVPVGNDATRAVPHSKSDRRSYCWWGVGGVSQSSTQLTAATLGTTCWKLLLFPSIWVSGFSSWEGSWELKLEPWHWGRSYQAETPCLPTHLPRMVWCGMVRAAGA